MNLKPCAHCAGQARYFWSFGAVVVECKDCGARVSTSRGGGDAVEAGAFELWNRRAVTAIDIATDNDTVTLFDPLNDSSDAFTVLAKLSESHVVYITMGTHLTLIYNFDLNETMKSETIVTDDASLRRAICEIAEKVSEI